MSTGTCRPVLCSLPIHHPATAVSPANLNLQLRKSSQSSEEVGCEYIRSVLSESTSGVMDRANRDTVLC
ncbi:hypothetical protein RRG08_061370 [Elysia crispata]|uniref:Uncharacterized protein n=1 Tax=Elysia crispata TaxID=231223 RepID=A0AAE1AFF5_9GAST|nr:hypothetical protein RRG08_061370 [Elysia crispata]